MKDIVFRPLVPSDEAFLWDMLYQAIYVPDGAPSPAREVIHTPELRRYVEDWGKPGDEGILALKGAIPVGAVWVRLLTGENKGYGYVDDNTPELSIAILPEYRGKGIGENLIRQLFDRVQGIFDVLCLSVSADNPAVRLYQRMGFVDMEFDGTSMKMVRNLTGD